jgi:hypothetical protein
MSSYEQATIYVNMTYKNLQTMYRPVATAQVLLSSTEDLVVCSNTTQITVRTTHFLFDSSTHTHTHTHTDTRFSIFLKRAHVRGNVSCVS